MPGRPRMPSASWCRRNRASTPAAGGAGPEVGAGFAVCDRCAIRGEADREQGPVVRQLHVRHLKEQCADVADIETGGGACGLQEPLETDVEALAAALDQTEVIMHIDVRPSTFSSPPPSAPSAA